MLDGVLIDWSHCWHITIGDDVVLAPRVQVFAHDASTKAYLGYTRIGKVEIGDRVFVGAGSVILPGVRIGSDVVIGAGSVVSHDIPDNVVAAGNPARVVGALDEYVARRKGEMDARAGLRRGVHDGEGRHRDRCARRWTTVWSTGWAMSSETPTRRFADGLCAGSWGRGGHRWARTPTRWSRTRSCPPALGLVYWMLAAQALRRGGGRHELGGDLDAAADLERRRAWTQRRHGPLPAARRRRGTPGHTARVRGEHRDVGGVGRGAFLAASGVWACAGLG